MSLPTDYNTTAIMYAARGGNPTVLAALLDAGSEVNHREDTGWTGLHFAIYGDHVSTIADCTRLLIKAGAWVDARCGDDMTPLDHCLRRAGGARARREGRQGDE